MKGLLVIAGLIISMGGAGGVEFNDNIGPSVLVTIAGLSMMYAGIILTNREGE